MPICYRVDHSRRLIVATATGTLTEDEIFGYQQEVRSRPDVASYGELFDLTGVTEIVSLSPVWENVRRLAAMAACKDESAEPGKGALVAPRPHIYGLSRMYQTYRELVPGSKRQVEVFRTVAEAMAFLGIPSPEEPETPRVRKAGGGTGE